jgi:hypothetical protein
MLGCLHVLGCDVCVEEHVWRVEKQCLEKFCEAKQIKKSFYKLPFSLQTKFE